MWLVWIALSRPYTSIVFALILFILGPLAIWRTPTDIFPAIDIPIVSVVWTYTGLPPDEMSNRITGVFERAVTTTVNDIEHMESESLQGVSVTKLFFHKGVNIALALSQVTAISQTLLRQFPPGTLPPLILSYNAATVPVISLVLSSSTLPEQNINDLGNNFIRTQLATVQGAALPYPYGGKVRQIQVDLNIKAMQTYGVTAQDINRAINAQNLIIPAGTEKIGLYEYLIKLNASPLEVEELNNLPLKKIPQGILYIRDVAQVRDGFGPQANIVKVDGIRAVMMPIEKTGSASTLDIVNKIKDRLPKMKEALPQGLNLTMFGDQSIFVIAAIEGVIKEGVIAATLTGLMILLVLGSWRSAFIITLSIPLSILASLTILSALGETINIMTLGGLALAVGILVDDATVTIENINWNLEQNKEVEQAILDGAQQISIPALVSTLCICIVFIPMFFIGGIAQYLFSPLAQAVVYAMLASYLLSRTLVPTLAKYLLKKHQKTTETHTTFARFHHSFENNFEKFRNFYQSLLKKVLRIKVFFIICFSAFLVFSTLLLWSWLGSDFFPTVDAGQIKLHLRAPTGTRVEETARITAKVDQLIRQVIPAKEITSIVDNIGLPISGINLTYNNSAPIGPGDADISISLAPDHKNIFKIIHQLRPLLLENFPGITFAFLPADIVNQILNFGLPSPINIQVAGMNRDANRLYAQKLLVQLKNIPGIVDARIKQADNYPTVFLEVNRSQAQDLGFSQLDVATNLLISLSGSFQTTPAFWLSPENSISYPLVTQVPQYHLSSFQDLANIPVISTSSDEQQQILGAVSTMKRTVSLADDSHYNAQPVIDIFASTEGRDLGAVAKDINKLIENNSKTLAKGSTIAIRGQIETQQQAFSGLYGGLFFSILLVYLLMVVNFQSWIDPFIIITALPAALTGIVWALFLTHTTISVPALTGAIMCMGVATANGILVISFARQHMKEGHDALSSALEAGRMRLRPVLMTAFAMIIGMLPMAIGFGEGGEQNAPLGRAVIGGLSFATIATLFFVPAVFYWIHGSKHNKSLEKTNG